MNETLKVSRQEIKYLISDYEISLLKCRFKNALKEDPYNKENGGGIQSEVYILIHMLTPIFMRKWMD